MVYAILIAGIVIIIYGLMATLKNEVYGVEDRGTELVRDSGMFDGMLQGTEILRRLSDIEEKIDMMSTAVENNRNAIYDVKRVESLVHAHKTQISIKHEDISDKIGDTPPATSDSQLIRGGSSPDLNKKIVRLKNEGKEVEEIASELGITKGEVLLRLGMKK